MKTSQLFEAGDVIIEAGCPQFNLLDTMSLREIGSLNKDQAEVEAVSISKSKSFALKHKNSDRINLHNTNGIQKIPSLIGAEGPNIAINDSGTLLAAGGYYDGKLIIYDIGQRASFLGATKSQQGPISSLTICHDRDELFWGTQNGEIYSLDTKSRSVLKKWTNQSNYVENIACVNGKGFVAEYRDTEQHIAYHPSPFIEVTLQKNSDNNLEGLTYDSNLSIAYGITKKNINRWKIHKTGAIEKLESLALPWPDKPWRTTLVGNSGKTLVLGSYEGEMAILNLETNEIVSPPKKTLPANVWSLTKDLNDKGFSASGAGSPLNIYNWEGTLIDAHQIDQFQFYASAVIDIDSKIVAFSSIATPVIVRDINGTSIGPQVREASRENIKFIGMTRDRYLIVGDSDYGLSFHDFNAKRLINTACGLLADSSPVYKSINNDIFTTAHQRCTRFKEMENITTDIPPLPPPGPVQSRAGSSAAQTGR